MKNFDGSNMYRVSNSTLCKTSVENAHHSTMLLSQVDNNTKLSIVIVTDHWSVNNISSQNYVVKDKMSIAIKNFHPSDSSDQHPGHKVPPPNSQVILPKTTFSVLNS